MILVNGNVLDSKETESILKSMEINIVNTLKKSLLNPLIVVEACNKLAETIEMGASNTILDILKNERKISQEQIDMVVHLLKKESLLYKLEMELGSGFLEGTSVETEYCNKISYKKILPLGVLFHIAAGNLDGLPVYSVVEGLLMGNINILKLPAVDKGFSIQLLSELIQIEPRLAEYIYVFDTPSNDLETLKKMSDFANGVIVWGGNAAIEAARRFVKVDTKLIEWGHKISFAYVTEKGMKDIALQELARHIFQTNQLLCSSCQGIYIDTNQMDKVYAFGERFIAIMEQVAREYPKPSIGIQAQITLQLYNQELEAVSSNKRIFRGKGCSVIASTETELTSCYQFGNCWVKPLPQEEMIEKLYPYKGYLQTAGLLCDSTEREELFDILGRAGVVRITEAKEMSQMLCGEAHDGEYPLRRYSRVVELR